MEPDKRPPNWRSRHEAASAWEEVFSSPSVMWERVVVREVGERGSIDGRLAKFLLICPSPSSSHLECGILPKSLRR